MAAGNIAIIGGTGFLGTAIAQALVDGGADVTRIARGSRPVPKVPGAGFAQADRSDEPRLSQIFADRNITDVIDIMTLTLGTTTPLLRAVETAGARYVMISAIDVYASYGGLMKLESPPVLNRPARETDALRQTRKPYRILSAKPAGIDPTLLPDYDKIPIEEAATARPALRSLILRLPALYGPGDPQKRFDWIMDALSEDAPIHIDSRIADWLQSYLYIADAARAIARAVATPAQGVFNIASPGSYSPLQWAQWFVAQSGKGLPVGRAPRALLRARADACDLRYPLTLDGQKFAAYFGPPVETPVAHAIAEMLDARGAAKQS